MGLGASASEKVRVAAEKEMPEEVGKREGRRVSGARGGRGDGAVLPAPVPTPEAAQPHAGLIAYLGMPRLPRFHNLPAREDRQGRLSLLVFFFGPWLGSSPRVPHHPEAQKTPDRWGGAE